MTTSDWLAVGSLLSDAAFELDLEFHFTGFGAAIAFGHATTTLLGAPASSLLADGGESFADILTTVRDGLVAWHGQVAILDANGEARMCRLALAPKLNLYGNPLGLYGMVIDLAAPELTAAVTPRLPLDRALDPETGFWSAGSFVEQASRRFDRLDVESQPGTLLFLGFGRAQGKLQTPTAMRLADELREIVRPTDLLGRINRTTIALWCDGMDHLTGAERAARFCKHLPAALPEQTLIAVGLVTRWPGSIDDPGTLIDRAGLALADAYAATSRDANGSWRVWQAAPPG
jgi:hypothetical protein